MLSGGRRSAATANMLTARRAAAAITLITSPGSGRAAATALCSRRLRRVHDSGRHHVVRRSLPGAASAGAENAGCRFRLSSFAVAEFQRSRRRRRFMQMTSIAADNVHVFRVTPQQRPMSRKDAADATCSFFCHRCQHYIRSLKRCCETIADYCHRYATIICRGLSRHAMLFRLLTRFLSRPHLDAATLLSPTPPATI